MKSRYLIFSLAASIVIGASVPEISAQQRGWYQQTEYQGREIGNLTGDVYYARQDAYVSVFMVTSEGIILVEPVGTEMAEWLKSELAERFPNSPVRYVIYSHYHWDHGSGAGVWSDTAQIVAQENAVAHLTMPPPDTPLPDNVSGQDTNGNGTIERSEATGQFQERFVLYDANEDGSLTGAEVSRGPIALVREPHVTFRDRLDIRLGGKLVEVISMPTVHADDNTIVRFVDGTNVLFASDWITINRTPFGPDVARRDEISKVRTVASMDFEHFVCSHGRLGTIEDVLANLEYREAVRERVAQGIAAGQTLEQIEQNVQMSEYADWEFRTQLNANVTGAYRALTNGL